MTREEKILLIKQIQAGDTSRLQQLREQKRNSEYFYPVFDYLCTHGRLSNSHWIKGNPLITIADLPEIRKMEGTELSEISFETLLKVSEIFDTIEMMDQAGTLQDLTPCYDSKIKPISQMHGADFWVAGEDLKGNAIVFVEADRLTDEQIENYKNS